MLATRDGKSVTLPPREFIRRFLQLVPPDGHVKSPTATSRSATTAWWPQATPRRRAKQRSWWSRRAPSPPPGSGTRWTAATRRTLDHQCVSVRGDPLLPLPMPPRRDVLSAGMATRLSDWERRQKRAEKERQQAARARERERRQAAAAAARTRERNQAAAEKERERERAHRARQRELEATAAHKNRERARAKSEREDERRRSADLADHKRRAKEHEKERRIGRAQATAERWKESIESLERQHVVQWTPGAWKAEYDARATCRPFPASRFETGPPPSFLPVPAETFVAEVLESHQFESRTFTRREPGAGPVLAPPPPAVRWFPRGRLAAILVLAVAIGTWGLRSVLLKFATGIAVLGTAVGLVVLLATAGLIFLRHHLRVLRRMEALASAEAARLAANRAEAERYSLAHKSAEAERLRQFEVAEEARRLAFADDQRARVAEFREREASRRGAFERAAQDRERERARAHAAALRAWEESTKRRRVWFEAWESLALAEWDAAEDDRAELLKAAERKNHLAMAMVLDAVLPAPSDVEPVPEADVSPSCLGHWMAVFGPDHIGLRVLLPGAGIIPAREAVLNPAGTEIVWKALPAKRAAGIYDRYVASTAVRLALTALRALPSLRQVDVQCDVDAIDPATGKSVNRPLLFAPITHQALSEVQLDQIDPVAFIEGLPGERRSITSSSARPLKGIPNTETWRQVDCSECENPELAFWAELPRAKVNPFAEVETTTQLEAVFVTDGASGQAIDLATNGARVQLARGHYGSAVLARPISLCADEAGARVGSSEVALVVDSVGVEVRNIRLSGTVRCNRLSEVLFDDCALVGEIVLAPFSRAVFVRCRFEPGAEAFAGIRVEDDASLEVRDCDFLSGRHAIISEGASLVTDCRFSVSDRPIVRPDDDEDDQDDDEDDADGEVGTQSEAGAPEEPSEIQMPPVFALDELNGQPSAVKRLQVAVAIAQSDGKSMEHTLLIGPEGATHSILARACAHSLGVGFHIACASSIRTKGDLAGLLTNLNDGDLIFVRDIHKVADAAVEDLRSAMDDRRFDVIIGEGRYARTFPIQLKPFTLIASTRALAGHERLGLSFGLKVELSGDPVADQPYPST